MIMPYIKGPKGLQYRAHEYHLPSLLTVRSDKYNLGRGCRVFSFRHVHQNPFSGFREVKHFSANQKPGSVG